MHGRTTGWRKGGYVSGVGSTVTFQRFDGWMSGAGEGGGGVEGGMDIAGESRTDNEVVDAGGGIWGGIP